MLGEKLQKFIYMYRKRKYLQRKCISHKCKRFEIGFHPIIHGLLSIGDAKLSSNISFDMFPPSQKPTSFATISALSCTWLASWGFVHNLFTNCNFLCFPTSGTSHFMYNASLSSTVKREVSLFARNSLSRFSALILQKQREVCKNLS